MKIYLAGPLFSEAEINQRNYEAKVLRDIGFMVYNPIEYNQSGGSLDPIDIYKKDNDELVDCDIIIADISCEDSGTIVELTQAIEYGKIVYVHDSDFRIRRNKYLEGMLVRNRIKIDTTFNDIELELRRIYE